MTTNRVRRLGVLALVAVVVAGGLALGQQNVLRQEEREIVRRQTIRLEDSKQCLTAIRAGGRFWMLVDTTLGLGLCGATAFAAGAAGCEKTVC
jgi:hypothetical protein